MKLSDNTLAVLKNFANINDGVLLKKGKSQRTIAPDKSVLVEAEFDEEIPNDFGVYALSQFLGNVTTLKAPEMTFTDQAVVLNDGEIKLTYRSAAASTILTPPDKKLTLSKVDAEFVLPNASLQKLLKIATMNNHSVLSVIGSNGKLHLLTDDGSNASHTAEMYLADYEGKDLSIKFKTEHLRMIPGDYNVQVSFDEFATFESKDGKLKYFVALLKKDK
jgi:hypothetical protein